MDFLANIDMHLITVSVVMAAVTGSIALWNNFAAQKKLQYLQINKTQEAIIKEVVSSIITSVEMQNEKRKEEKVLQVLSGQEKKERVIEQSKEILVNQFGLPIFDKKIANTIEQVLPEIEFNVKKGLFGK